ncbi:2-succinyl-5-enolpyruvyl-6-hydroxy-3-cyclohexene-1-carboxylic-acid synthase [soil metagenome]
MTGSGSPASAFATALLAELVRGGVRDLVLSPGSRSQALALAAAQFERAGMLRLRVRIDERSAGFLAVGLAVESGHPVVVVTTSGTAVAELHPAVLEAAHSGVPLIVLTADRPVELLGIGANQTTQQAGIFGAAARSVEVAAPVDGGDHAADAALLAVELLDGIAGPVHANIAFRDPLSGPVALPQLVPAGLDTPLRGYSTTEAHDLPILPATVVIAGTVACPDAEAAARALGAPLLAEVASGARFGPNLVPAYRELLTTANFGDRVARAIVFGHPTLSREIPALIERDGVETIVVRSPGVDDYNPGHRVQTFVDAVTVADDEAAVEAARSWVGRWVSASRQLLEQEDPLGAALTDDYAERAAFARDQLAEQREPVTRRMLVEAIWRASWPHDRLVLGASRLIRELDRVATGKRIPVHANRGLAGIDGTIATATGIALASQADDAAQPGITRVLLGDLALLHDAGSLLTGDGEPRPRMQVIVGNDGGGTIFDALEVAATADPADVNRVLLTPQTVDLAALASAYGWEYRRVTTRGELDPALTPSAGRVLIEVPLPRM